MPKILIIFVLSVVSLPLQATTVDTADFGADPGIQFYFSQNLIVTPYVDNGQLRATFAYRLDSSISTVGVFSPQSLDGWFYIDVAQNYDLNENEHEIRLGFTELNPQDPVNQAFFYGAFGGNLPEYISWYVSTDGLINSSVRHFRDEYPFQVVSGDLWFSPGEPQNVFSDAAPFLCIECGLDLTLNLQFMDFSGGTLAMNFMDESAFILAGHDFFSGNEPYGFNMNLTAVPVPAAWVLLATALTLLSRRQLTTSGNNL